MGSAAAPARKPLGHLQVAARRSAPRPSASHSVGESLRCGRLHFLTQVPNRREPKRERERAQERELNRERTQELNRERDSHRERGLKSERKLERERAQESSSERERQGLQCCNAAAGRTRREGRHGGARRRCRRRQHPAAELCQAASNVVIHVLSNSFVDTHITCCELPAF